MRASTMLCAALVACASPEPDGLLVDSGQDVLARAQPTVIGGDRPAPVVAPEDVGPRETLPAIVLLHGYQVDAALQDLLFQLSPRVQTSRFLLVLPEGTQDANGDPFWNAAEECCGVGGPDVDDVAYLSALIAELREGWNVSTVGVVGHSNGGYMAYRLACDAPSVVDRMVVVVGSEPVEPPDCVDGPPTALLHLHGTADGVVPYTAASGPVATPGAEVSVARQAARNGCGTTTEPLGAADLVRLIDGEESRGVAYADCEAATSLWTAEGEAHLFVSATELLRDGITAFALGTGPVFGE